MKKLCTWLIMGLSFQLHAQILYDNGAIGPPPSLQTSSLNSSAQLKWNKSTISYYFLNGTSDVSGNTERDAVRQGMRLWQDVSGISFVEAGSADNADIRIGWYSGNHGDGYSFDGVNNILAHAFYPPPNNGALAGDVHFDDAENWSASVQSNSNQPIDLVTIAAHEIGHALGLAHSSNTNALMYAYYNGSHRYLHRDDISSINQLYPPPPTLSSLDRLCPGATKTITLSNLPAGTTPTWTASANVSIVSSNNSSATVRPASSTVDGRGWIRATLNNGTKITEEFDVVGSTLDGNNISLHSSPYTLYNARWHVISAIYNGIMHYSPDYSWEWRVPGSLTRQSGDPFIHIRSNSPGLSYIYVKVRLCWECGCSTWKSSLLTIPGHPGGGSIIGLPGQ